MSPAALLDANIPVYAAGRDHPKKDPSAQVLAMARDHPTAFWTNVEVLQEIMHLYRRTRRWELGQSVLRGFTDLMAGRIEPVFVRDIEVAATLADRHEGLSARDLVHAAVMQRLGIERIVSADAGFDRLPDVIRLDPADVGAWRDDVLADNE